MLRRFLPVAVILSLVLRLIFFATETYLYVPEALTFIFAQRRILSIIIALIIAAIDSLIYRAGQKQTEAAKAYSDIVDGAFIRRNKERERKMLLKATAAYSRSKFKSAEAKLNKLIKKCDRNRDFYAVHCLFGLIYNAKGKDEEALEHWKKATEYESGKAYGYSMLSGIYLKMKKYNEAIENGEKALELDEKLYMPKENLCIAYKAIGDEENFAKYYNAVKTFNPFSKIIEEKLAAVSN